jgi:23S rRNA pseudouridine2605 synthase
MDSEGLLLMTNDGEFANRLMHPKHEVKKTYEVWVTKFHEAATALLSRSIELDGYLIKSPEVKLIREENGKAKYLMTIHEGRNRQIRRMCEAAGMKVQRLRRVSEGAVKLGRLPLGQWRDLTEDELAELK